MAAEEIFGNVMGYIWEDDDGVTVYIPENTLTATEKAFIDSKYTAGGPLKTQLGDDVYPATGLKAVRQFEGYTTRYNPDAPNRVVQESVPEVGDTYEQAEVNAIVRTTNAIRNIV